MRGTTRRTAVVIDTCHAIFVSNEAEVFRAMTGFIATLH